MNTYIITVGHTRVEAGAMSTSTRVVRKEEADEVYVESTDGVLIGLKREGDGSATQLWAYKVWERFRLVKP